MAGCETLCCHGAKSENDSEETVMMESDEVDDAEKEKRTPEGLKSAAEELMDRVPEFLSYIVPKQIRPTDAGWKRILTAVRSFYRWCVTKKSIEADDVMIKSLLSLRLLPLDTLPKVINFLGAGRYWEKLKHGEHEAVSIVEAMLHDWRKQKTLNAPYLLPFLIQHLTVNETTKDCRKEWANGGAENY